MATIYGGNFDKGNKAVLECRTWESDDNFGLWCDGQLYSNVTWSNYTYTGTLSCDGSWTGSKGSWSNGKYSTFTLISDQRVCNVTKSHDWQSRTATWSITSNSGASSSCSYTVSIPPRTSYTVSYNANGGINPPGSQTKWYGENLKLHTSIPTRTNYKFMGWSTSSNGSVAYAAGASYANNSSVTLYAVWELAYVAPKIENLIASRIEGNETAINISFNWTAGTNGSTVLGETITIFKKLQSDSSYPSSAAYTSSVTAASGTVSTTLTGFNTDSQYDLLVKLTDSAGSMQRTTYVSTVAYIIDINKDGTGIGIGKASEGEGLEIGWAVKVLNDSGVLTKLRDYIHPIGSIYISASSTNPALIWGGTWTQIKGRFLIATGDNDANTTNYWGSFSANTINCPAGEKGGEPQHTLSINEMPEHNHKGRFKGSWQTEDPSTGSNLNIFSHEAYGWLGSNEQYTDIGSVDNSHDSPVQPSGGGKAHSNMPPYLSVYMWQRTG